MIVGWSLLLFSWLSIVGFSHPNVLLDNSCALDSQSKTRETASLDSAHPSSLQNEITQSLLDLHVAHAELLTSTLSGGSDSYRLREFSTKLSLLVSEFRDVTHPSKKNSHLTTADHQLLALRASIEVSETFSSPLMALSPIVFPFNSPRGSRIDPISTAAGELSNLRFWNTMGHALLACPSVEKLLLSNSHIVALAGSRYAFDPYVSIMTSSGNLSILTIKFSSQPDICVNVTTEWTLQTTIRATEGLTLTTASMKGELFLLLANSLDNMLSVYSRKHGRFIGSMPMVSKVDNTNLPMGISTALGTALFFAGNSIGTLNARTGRLGGLLCQFQLPLSKSITAIAVDHRRANKYYLGTKNGRIFTIVPSGSVSNSVSSDSQRSPVGCRILQQIALPESLGSVSRILTLSYDILVVVTSNDDRKQQNLIVISQPSSTVLTTLSLDGTIRDATIAYHFTDGYRVIILMNDGTLSIYDFIPPKNELLQSVSFSSNTTLWSTIHSIFKMAPILLIVIAVGSFQYFRIKKRLDNYASRKLDALTDSQFALHHFPHQRYLPQVKLRQRQHQQQERQINLDDQNQRRFAEIERSSHDLDVDNIEERSDLPLDSRTETHLPVERRFLPNLRPSVSAPSLKPSESGLMRTYHEKYVEDTKRNIAEYSVPRLPLKPFSPPSALSYMFHQRLAAKQEVRRQRLENAAIHRTNPEPPDRTILCDKKSSEPLLQISDLPLKHFPPTFKSSNAKHFHADSLSERNIIQDVIAEESDLDLHNAINGIE